MSQIHTGGCHCGAVRYTVEGLDLQQIITCNCSICSKTGTILGFVGADAFRLDAGEEALTDYQFNHKTIHHLFCRHCGIRSFARGTDPKGQAMVAINVRCLEGVDLQALEPTAVDGRSL